jgi:hypothetical protein
MSLAELKVLNYRAPAGAGEIVVAGNAAPAEACVIRTCLREVQIATHASFEAGKAAANGAEIYRGAEAYGFLLRLACGLDSEIAGETEILGQIKSAWRDFETQNSLASRRLRPWMQRLLQETKEIRSQYIVGLGSATYGSLARRLLGGRPTGTTLLIGAGQLAATVLPYLESHDLRVYNRNPARALQMLAAQRERADAGRVTVLEPTLAAEMDAWREARDVILCVPADATRDAARVAAWRGRSVHAGRVLHLGLRSAAGSVWESVSSIATLDDLFGLRDTQAEQREALLARARRVCAEKAQLAELDDAAGSRPGASTHGWEDLAAFQALGS